MTNKDLTNANKIGLFDNVCVILAFIYNYKEKGRRRSRNTKESLLNRKMLSTHSVSSMFHYTAI